MDDTQQKAQIDETARKAKEEVEKIMSGDASGRVSR